LVIDGINKEADETVGEIEDKAALDAAIVANCEAVEHYEISRYGTPSAWAESLGREGIVRFLRTNLNKETAANTMLGNQPTAERATGTKPAVRNSLRLCSDTHDGRTAHCERPLGTLNLTPMLNIVSAMRKDVPASYSLCWKNPVALRSLREMSMNIPAIKARQDRSKINLSEGHQVRYWTKHLGVSREQLERAVEKVGNSAVAVRKELGFIGSGH